MKKVMEQTPLVSPNREVLRLAIPSILANITIPLVGIVDVAIVGHVSDAAGIGGIAIGTMLFDLLYWNFGFLRLGASGLTAQAYGRGDMREAVGIFKQTGFIAGCSALAVWALQWLFLFALFGSSGCLRPRILLHPYLGCPRHARADGLQRVVHRHAEHRCPYGV